MINATTSKVGLISWPIGHSLSPVMQNAAFQALSLNYVYLPLPVKPNELEVGVKGLKALTFSGFNVSVPFKTQIIRYLDELDAAATQMQAVNTIKISDGKLMGSNTDPVGFIRALTGEGVNPKGMNILVIGAGGAARAAIYGLSHLNVSSVTVLDVIETKAVTLVKDLAKLYPAKALRYLLTSEVNIEKSSKKVDLVINASPIGMHPDMDVSPWPENVALPVNAIFFDMIYNPRVTKFLSRAKTEGYQWISGLGMLVHQGAASFELWTGVQPSIDIMYDACLRALP